MKPRRSIYTFLLLPIIVLSYGFFNTTKNTFEEPNFSCPTGNVVLDNQAEVDAWVAEWGGCTKIEGNLIIGFNSVYGVATDITDISGFLGLEEVTGLVFIQKTSLPNLNGLNNLHTIGGDFIRISYNYNLENIQALQNISLANNLEISNNFHLENLDGLSGLTKVNEEFLIEDNRNLEHIQALSNLTEAHIISIKTAGKLKNLIGLEGLSEIHSISIIGNDSLSSLQGLNNLEKVNDVFSLGGTYSAATNGSPPLENLEGLNNLKYAESINISASYLTDFTGLENLDSVEHFNINHNSTLVSFDGLNNLVNVGFNFLIRDNYALTDISALSNLKNVKGNFHITRCIALENLNGLGGLEKVKNLWIDENESLPDLNGLNAAAVYEDAFYIHENNSLTTLSGLSNFTSIDILSIRDNNLLTDISQLSELSKVESISIKNNDALEDLSGLENLTKISKYLIIEDNQILSDIDEFQNIDSIGMSVLIKNNDSLKNLIGLKNLIHVTEDLEIINNSSLKELLGLGKLKTVWGNFFIEDNEELKNLKRLRSLNYVGGNLRIASNPSLSDIRGINRLESVGEYVAIIDNDVLRKINGLRNLETAFGGLSISNNAVIQNIDGLDKLNFIDGYIYINGNPELSNCDVDFICHHLLENRPYQIENNKEGCNDLVANNYCGFNTFKGSVIRDQEDLCLPNLGEVTLSGWKIKASSSGYDKITFSDDQGNYLLNVDTGEFSISVIPPSDIWNPCPINQVYQVDSSYDTVLVDLLVQPLVDCPIMDVTLISTPLRSCRKSNYVVDYCNLGTADAIDAFVTIYLHPLLDPVSSSIPFTFDVDSNLIFQLGDVPIGECGSFSFELLVSCEAENNQVICATATIFPDIICPPPSQSWSAADVFVEGNCNVTEVKFSIGNIGSGDMDSPSNYRIYRDAIPFENGSFQLLAGETFELDYPLDGYTYRLEADQVPDHPLDTSPSSTIEACVDGNTPFSTGYALQFPVEDYANTFDRYCRPVTGSYDPNDKQGFPLGCGDEHYIEANSTIDYLIRFQNTGNDTAFLVVIVDTLPENLDANSIELGTASHPYHMEVFDGNIAHFTFENIMLPDSNVNLLASNGFVSFKIRQEVDLPVGTEFINSAAIYFDFNEAIITNATHHKIGTHTFLTIEEVILCEGEAYEGVVYTQNTSLNDTVSFGVVETVHSIQIEVIPALQTTIDAIIIIGDLYNGVLFETDTILLENYVDQYGCDSIVTTNIMVNPLSNNFPNLEKTTISISPNPFSKISRVSIENFNSQFGVFELYDLMGKKILEKTFYADHFEISRDGVSSGVYFYRVILEGEYVGDGKVVVE